MFLIQPSLQKNKEGQSLIGDFDGDGMDDILSINIENHQTILAKSNGDGFDNITLVSSEMSHKGETNSYFYIGDFNGDGKDDVMRDRSDTQTIYFSNGDAFSDGVVADQYNTLFSHNWHIGDFNGDGLDDILSIDSSNSNSNLHRLAMDLRQTQFSALNHHNSI